MNPLPWFCAVLLFVGFPSANAQVITDGSLGPIRQLSGPDMRISDDLGTRSGTNLFHSFAHFDVPRGARATFTGPAQIERVISRVTGGQGSRIDGTLRSEIGHADLYLINPAGVVFGPEASVDVPASLHISTADELRFRDGSRFSAIAREASTLSIAAPEAFGFLGREAPGNLRLEGSRLELAPRETLSLSGGELSIQGGADRQASLATAGGSLRLTAVGSAATAVETAESPNSSAAEVPYRGRLTIDQARLDTSGEGGGSITLGAGTASITDSSLLAENRGTTDARGGIRLGIADSIALQGSALYADTAASGVGGVVQLQAGQLQMDDSWITSDSYRSASSSVNDPIGDAGGVIISTLGSLELANGSLIRSDAFAEGEAGSVVIAAGDLHLDNGGVAERLTGIFSDTHRDASGNSGRVKIQVSSMLGVIDGAYISSETYGGGDSGGVEIAAGSLRLDHRGKSDGYTGLYSSAYSSASGQAGGIDLRVDGLLEMLDGAVISSETFGAGDAGSIRIAAGGLRLDGGSTDQITAIYSDANEGSSGNAGRLSINVADRMDILRGARISSSTFSVGEGAPIEIAAGRLLIDGEHLPERTTGVFSVADHGSSGNAGSLTLRVEDQLDLLRGGMILTSTGSIGQAGSVTISAGALRLDNSGVTDDITAIFTGAFPGSAGAAGSLDIRVDRQMELYGGAYISSETHGTGNSGDILVTAGSVRLDHYGLDDGYTGLYSGAYPNPEGESGGNAGSIDIHVANRMDLNRGAQISNSTWSSGEAGQITITAGDLLLDNGELQDQVTGIFSRANDGSTGNGGALRLSVDGLLEVSGGAFISGSTYALGDAGSIEIAADAIRLDDGTIGSLAGSAATGQVGNLLLDAERIMLADGSRISIVGDQAVATASDVHSDARHIQIRSGSLELNASRITAETTGTVDAAAILIDAQELKAVNDSAITTESMAADAGLLTIEGGYLWLRDSRVTTSAEGSTGDGGDILIHSKQLILDGGFVQANTAAVDARGGDILIGSEVLIASSNNAEIGGEMRAEFIPGSGRNIIQAAAPLGVRGDISLATLDLDITATLVPLRTPFQNTEAILSDLCRVADAAQASALIDFSAGNPAPRADTPRAVPINEERLTRLLKTAH